MDAIQSQPHKANAALKKVINVETGTMAELRKKFWQYANDHKMVSDKDGTCTPDALCKDLLGEEPLRLRAADQKVREAMTLVTP